VPVFVVRLAAAVVRDSLVTGIEMSLEEFRQSLTESELPAGLTHALAGLWFDAKGDWVLAPEENGAIFASIGRSHRASSECRRKPLSSGDVDSTAVSKFLKKPSLSGTR
jgi:hypothetical protein